MEEGREFSGDGCGRDVSGRSGRREEGNVPSLSLGLEEGKDVVLANGALDVPVYRTVSFPFVAATEGTHLMMLRVESSMNSTRTWVTPPREPVRPRTLTTLASLTWVLEDSYEGEEGTC